MRRIDRIQNADLWAAYKQQRDYLLTVKYKPGSLRVNASCPGTEPILEHRMWHGTKCVLPSTIYNSALGWCASYANPNGSYGAGTYFAYSPSYSMRGYASADGNGCYQLLLADVLTGVESGSFRSLPGQQPALCPFTSICTACRRGDPVTSCSFIHA
ncbi:MAG: hypothetical protein HC767_12870 [Akkermansiaceae bacterium]|nr:hypothetical protein [Akkermansiaceae bacterium]